jgi:hypothetical protein
MLHSLAFTLRAIVSFAGIGPWVPQLSWSLGLFPIQSLDSKPKSVSLARAILKVASKPLLAGLPLIMVDTEFVRYRF